MRTPPTSLLPLFFAIALVSRTDGLVVREYDPSIDKRLLGFPEIVYHVTPTPNPAFIANAPLMRGIGWPDDSKEWTRQMALVSPRHLVCASHYKLDPAWRIIFVGNDGAQHFYGIESQTPVIGPDGVATDLMVVTLSSPVDTTLGITPFPVLNLKTESDYIGKPLLVCGSFVDSGFAKINGHITLTNDPGFDTTRFIYFDYDKNAKNGRPNDCSYYYGDSGSPGFMLIKGRPVIVGTCSGFDDLTPDDGTDGPVFRNYLSSIHTYLDQVDAIMERQGYHLQRFYPLKTNVSTKITAACRLRQSKPGSVVVATATSGASGAHNVMLQLTFPTAPTAVSGAGWICKPITPLVWTCMRGGVPKSSSRNLTASWNQLPSTATFKISAKQSYDGAASVITKSSFTLTPAL